MTRRKSPAPVSQGDARGLAGTRGAKGVAQVRPERPAQDWGSGSFLTMP